MTGNDEIEECGMREFTASFVWGGKMSDRSDFRILSLDGGGSKGVYTLGVLKEIEAMTKRSLHEEFDLIYGASCKTQRMKCFFGF